MAGVASVAQARVPALLVLVGTGDFKDGEEGFLRDVDLADALHALFAFFLFFEELAFAGDVSAVAFGENVLSDGGYGFAGDDPAADGGLNGDLKHLPRNEFAQAGDQVAAPLVGLLAMANHGERVDRLAADQHVQLNQVRFDVAGEVIIERSVAARNAFEAIVKIENEFVERSYVGEKDSSG